jgi:hypothetical protein
MKSISQKTIVDKQNLSEVILRIIALFDILKKNLKIIFVKIKNNHLNLKKIKILDEARSHYLMVLINFNYKKMSAVKD